MDFIFLLSWSDFKKGATSAFTSTLKKGGLSRLNLYKADTEEEIEGSMTEYYQQQQKEKEQQQQQREKEEQQQQRKSSTMPRNTAPSGAPLTVDFYDEEQRPATRTGIHGNV